MKPPLLETRAHPREALRCPVKFEVVGAELIVEGVARDVSLGGMFVETDAPLPYGTDVVIFMPVESEKRVLRMPARVRWRREGGMGLQFGALGAVETHALLMAVASSVGGP